MKIDFRKNLLNFRGQPVMKIVNGKEISQKLSDMVAEALYSAGMDPQKPMDTSKKLKAYNLLQQIIHNNGIIEAETEDVALLKEICAGFFTAGAYGQIHELIEKGK
ncbi:hypothetical protein [Bacteroides clarus]|mgnify:CR=1 FL=1|jgi:hypothetical protein|uniref:hypothetical protein n=1 Tax=Bacteroides clarus TaxID=626929 RepID=UPI0018A95CCE|nr:hypothetical protein [Bacteroides clarus]